MADRANIIKEIMKRVMQFNPQSNKINKIKNKTALPSTIDYGGKCSIPSIVVKENQVVPIRCTQA